MPTSAWLSPFHDTGICKMIGNVLTQVPIGRDSGDRFIVETPQIDPKTKDVKTYRIRVFDSKNDENDCSWFYRLPDIGNLLPIKFEVYATGKGDADFAANAMPLEKQPKELREYIESSVKKIRSSELLRDIRDSVAIINTADIDPLSHWIDNNPEVILTKSQQRVRGKTDKELMTIVSIFAKRKGVKPCDVINAVMWESVHNGSIWKTQIEENNAES